MLNLWETCLQIFLKVTELTKKIIQCIRGKYTSWKDLWQKMWQVSLRFCFSQYIKIQGLFSNSLLDKWNKLFPNASLYLHSFLCYIHIIWLQHKPNMSYTYMEIYCEVNLATTFSACLCLKNLTVLLWLLLKLSTAKEESGTFLQKGNSCIPYFRNALLTSASTRTRFI